MNPCIPFGFFLPLSANIFPCAIISWALKFSYFWCVSRTLCWGHHFITLCLLLILDHLHIIIYDIAVPRASPPTIFLPPPHHLPPSSNCSSEGISIKYKLAYLHVAVGLNGTVDHVHVYTCTPVHACMHAHTHTHTHTHSWSATNGNGWRCRMCSIWSVCSGPLLHGLLRQIGYFWYLIL